MPDLLHRRSQRLAAAAAMLLLVGGPAAAQSSATHTPRPDPTDARAAVPPQVHRSVFSTYQRAVETPVGSWRELNDATARAGGWRAYAREAATEGATNAPAAASAPQRSGTHDTHQHQHPHQHRHHQHGGHKP